MMNSHERLRAALDGQAVDHIPVVPKIWVDFAAINTNTSLFDVVSNPLTALEVIARAGSYLGVDAVRQFPFPARRMLKEEGKIFEIERSGRKLGVIDQQGGLSTQLFDASDYHIDDPVTMAYYHNWMSPKPVVNSIEDAHRIAVPDSGVFDQLDWATNQKTVIDKYPDLCFIGDCDSATMSFYVAFRGMTNTMLDLIMKPQLVQLLEHQIYNPVALTTAIVCSKRSPFSENFLSL